MATIPSLFLIDATSLLKCLVNAQQYFAFYTKRATDRMGKHRAAQAIRLISSHYLNTMTKSETNMQSIQPGVSAYPKEKPLFIISASFAILFWVLITIGSFGLVWVFMLIAYILGLFLFSYFITYVRGNGVRVNEYQFGDIAQAYVHCCEKIGMGKKVPALYIITGNGVLNAFAARFLRRYYVVLYSDIVDALKDDANGLKFYLGHELGHIAQRHLSRDWWLWPSRWIPLLATAHSRSMEYTCDQYGLYCCESVADAQRALAVIAVGHSRFRTLNTDQYIEQSRETGGFWMSVNELTGTYPWLSKRMARISSSDVKFPRRSFFAWIVAAITPNTGFGLFGSTLVYVYVSILLIPFGISSYQEYSSGKAVLTEEIKYASSKTIFEDSYSSVEKHWEIIAPKKQGQIDGAAVAIFIEKIKANNPAISDIEVQPAQGDESLKVIVQFKGVLSANHMIVTATEKDEVEEEGAQDFYCEILGDVSEYAVPSACHAPDGVDTLETKGEPSLLERLIKRML